MGISFLSFVFLGDQIGHAVARHAAEGITKNLWFAILQLILYQFIMPDVVHAMSTLLLRLPFSRRYVLPLHSFASYLSFSSCSNLFLRTLIDQ